MAAVTATGVPNPDAPSKKAPKEKAINNNCNRVSCVMPVGWGIGLLGVGVIILGKQATREYMALGFEIFGVICGVLFVLGGVWELLSIRVSLVPIVCIAAGVALLLSALFGKATD